MTIQVKEDKGPKLFTADYPKPLTADNLKPLTVEDPKPLTVDDLATVQHEVWEGRAKWYIGLALKLTPGTLDAIQKTNHHVINDCLTATLKEWLSKPELHPSWSCLSTALRDKTVGLEDIAEQLPKIIDSQTGSI